MKYIDSEKLVAEIERMRGINKIAFMTEHIKSEVFHGRAQAINHLFEFITSLQQEQPLTIEKVVEQCKRFGGNPEVIQPEVDLEKAAKEFAHNYDMGTCDEIAQDCFKAGAEWQREQYECIPAEEAYMRGFAQGAKEEREDIITRIRNQVKLWMPDNPEGDEYINGKRLAFRSVLVLLDEMEGK